MEATLFTGWVYDFLKPHALELKVAHPEMLKAIMAAKKKNDRTDSERITDLLRVNLLPECYMASEEIRELRRILRYRNLMVRTSVKMKNKVSGLLMEVGAEYNKKRLHGRKYFDDLLEKVEDVPPSVINLLKLSRASLDMFQGVQKRLLCALQDNELIRERVKRLQTVLIEAAKLAPRWNPQLAAIYAKETARGNRNRATLAVVRKLVSYMMAVDKRGSNFEAMMIAEASLQFAI